MNPWTLLQEFLRGTLDFLNQDMSLSYGWAIVILTVLVRIVLLPLVVKQYSSMRAMQSIAPELKEIQARHKGDRSKLNEEMMRLYQERGVNPFASCLPLVAQLPIFFALYWVLRDFSRHAAEGGVGDLSFLWLVSDITIDLGDLGVGGVVMALVYALSQLLSTELTMNASTPPTQRRIFRVMPIAILVGIYIYPFPAGLLVYWVTTNLWTAGQQLVMRHRLGLAPVPQAGPTNATGGTGSRTPARNGAAAAVGEASPDDGAGDEPGQMEGDAGEPAAEAAGGNGDEVTEGAAPAGGAKKGNPGGGRGNGKKRTTPRGRKGKGGRRRRPARKRR